MIARATPYPSDTRAKGWRFELDLERVQQSDTWALASPEIRPWLLMLWTTAWQQMPCGSMPADDELIAARLGMPMKAYLKAKPVLMRGWWLAEDGRLYHDTIASRVLEMLNRKEAERQRKADYRARKEAERNPPPAEVVPDVSHGTGEGQTRESTGCDDTGTGTGTGTGLRERESNAGRSAACAPATDEPEPVRTVAGALCLRLREAGITRTNPGNIRLTTLLDAGATTAEFMAYADKAKDADDPFAYLLGCVEGERKRAKAGVLHKGPLPNKQEAIEQKNRTVAERWARRHQSQQEAAA